MENRGRRMEMFHQQGLVESGDFQETNSSGESLLASRVYLPLGQPVSV